MINVSSINIVIDVGAGKIIEDWLFNIGFNFFGIRTMNPEMDDMDIVKLANSEKRDNNNYGQRFWRIGI